MDKVISYIAFNEFRMYDANATQTQYNPNTHSTSPGSVALMERDSSSSTCLCDITIFESKIRNYMRDNARIMFSYFIFLPFCFRCRRYGRFVLSVWFIVHEVRQMFVHSVTFHLHFDLVFKRTHRRKITQTAVLSSHISMVKFVLNVFFSLLIFVLLVIHSNTKHLSYSGADCYFAHTHQSHAFANSNPFNLVRHSKRTTSEKPSKKYIKIQWNTMQTI